MSFTCSSNNSFAVDESLVYILLYECQWHNSYLGPWGIEITICFFSKNTCKKKKDKKKNLQLGISMSRLTELPVLELMCLRLAFSPSYALGRLSCYWITNVCHDMPWTLMYIWKSYIAYHTSRILKGMFKHIVILQLNDYVRFQLSQFSLPPPPVIPSLGPVSMTWDSFCHLGQTPHSFGSAFFG